MPLFDEPFIYQRIFRLKRERWVEATKRYSNVTYIAFLPDIWHYKSKSSIRDRATVEVTELTNWAAQLSPVATAEVRNHIVKYELYRHRNLLDRFQEAAVDLSDKLVEGRSKRTYWEVIYYLCGCWFRNQPPTVTGDVGSHPPRRPLQGDRHILPQPS